MTDINSICIKGSPEHGKRIIQFFERLGGINKFELDGDGENRFYFINPDGDIAFWTILGKPKSLTEITLSDTLLPSEWCVPCCDEVVNWLNKRYSVGYDGTNSRFNFGMMYGVVNGKPRSDKKLPGLELTPSQFTALTAPRKEEKEFVWTDELAVEFATWSCTKAPTMQGRYTDVEQFKASKREEKIVIAGKDVSFEGDNIFLGNNGYIKSNDLADIVSSMKLWGVTHLTISGEQVPIETLQKILDKLNK